MKEKIWSCGVQCKAKLGCCGDYFLSLDDEQKESFEKEGVIIGKPKYTDYRWLSFRKSIKIEKQALGFRKIIFDKSFKHKLLYNPIWKTWMLYVDDKCQKVTAQGKCSIYRVRPKPCKVALCPVFEDDKNPLLKFFGENSKMKKERQMYKKGKLKKW